ncbi:uncharacterized protein LOC144885011 [Branchiostoma floridae x Branchiostoma japonicum]
METETLLSSKQMSLPEVGVFLTPPSTPAVKQEPPAGPGADCSRGEDGLVPVPAHQPCRQGKSRSCHHGSTGPPPETLQYQDGYDVYYSPERTDSPPSVFTFPSPDSPRPDYPAPPATLPEQYYSTQAASPTPEHYYTGQTPSPAPVGDALPPEQRPLTPRYVDATENPSFAPADAQQASDTDTTPMTVYEVYCNADFRSWDQSDNSNSLPGTAGVFGSYHGPSMSPVEPTSPAQSPPCPGPPAPCYPAAYTALAPGNSPSAVPSPQGSAPAHFPRDRASPDPGQTFDFPAPYSVPHEAAADTLRHREAMGIPPPAGPKQPDLSEQQLDRFLRQTRREFADLLAEDPGADRRGMSCHPPGMELPGSPRQHPPQPGLTDRDLEEVQTLIMQEVSRDIEVAFKVVQVPRDPRTWSHTDVARWLRWTADQYRLPNVYLECFPLDGAQLCELAEREFIYRAPESGQILYALLDIWKSGMANAGPGGRSTVCTINKKPMSYSNHYVPNCSPYPVQDALPPTEKAVHLWQFLRELLSQPESYSRFIRWMDRGKGIFKIEDSVQVARLWGIRKSRPAMNYDKLSRSIRQYYKKGIIRKPDQAQRLVYQFVKN